MVIYLRLNFVLVILNRILRICTLTDRSHDQRLCCPSWQAQRLSCVPRSTFSVGTDALGQSSNPHFTSTETISVP